MSDAAAFARARSGDEPTMPTTSWPSRRSASVWAIPMNPVPMTPTRAGFTIGLRGHIPEQQAASGCTVIAHPTSGR